MIWSVIIDGLAGWIAGKIMNGEGYGLIVDILLGIAGGWVGRWLFGILGLHFGGTIGSIITSVVGAVTLIYVVRLIKK